MQRFANKVMILMDAGSIMNEVADASQQPIFGRRILDIIS
jgi:hypothetical protein